ncbi:ketoacyl-ACP synthase III family protein [Streptomyces sp. NBC_00503]|uniref:ketoacyl-ACP synthase III family protein n=1 Tax=Streptomyces sp. NBC_00503 TaxID=2903659 RepID=UPI002E8209AB|nr:ketoacyl-ACP synthase III family protein [Streptomyces sp. NBC_00503]WUD86551.1 ketoacyl-ACP synthase III family protein [Streptomyces sp. NBC_00503]
MRFENLYLAGIASWLPEVVDTDQAVKEGLLDPAVREASGIESVAVAGNVAAPDMAVTAAEAAVRRSGRRPEEFAALLHSSAHFQGPDGWSAQHYILRKTLDRPIPAIEVRQGCLGMLAALELAAHRLIADPSRPAVLITAADNFGTPMVDRWRASGLFLLADGAAAAVVSSDGGFARVLAAGSLSNPEMEEFNRGGEVLFPPPVTLGQPLNLEARRQYWRDQWAKGVLPPMGNLGELVADVAERTLEEAGVAMDQVRRVVHIGFSKGPLDDTFLDPLDIDGDRGVWEFTRRTGHAGAVDPFAGLEYLLTTGQLTTGDHVMLIGAAPGAEVTCAVIEITAPMPD